MVNTPAQPSDVCIVMRSVQTPTWLSTAISGLGECGWNPQYMIIECSSAGLCNVDAGIAVSCKFIRPPNATC